MNIMRAKKALPSNVFINDDLIKRDRVLRAKARQFAKSIATPGQNVRVRTGSLWIDDTKYEWNEDTQNFTKKN